MGVIPTGTIYKTLSFDGKGSDEFSVYITGSAVFNAPERAVEMVSIPGRNGAFALDQGRFENIEVTYNCGIVADDETDFAEAISDFRNWLCSRDGYCRLSDDYNAGEYRLAVYKSGLEVEPAQLIAGEFDIVFNAKPQRFLTSGETKITVTSGDDIANPTLFDASPLLEVTGYGDINIGSDTIEVHNEPIGRVQLFNGNTWNSGSTRTIVCDMQYANVGDEIILEKYAMYNATWKVSTGTITGLTKSATGDGGDQTSLSSSNSLNIYPILRDLTFAYGTAATKTVTGNYNIVTSAYGTLTGSATVSLAYDGDATFTLSRSVTKPAQMTSSDPQLKIQVLALMSTQTALGNPLYIDLDIGEAYKIEGGVVASVNNGVALPPELSVLSPGNTTITFDNTFSKVEIVPRWWKV